MTEEEIALYRRKDNIGIVIDGYFSARCKGVRRRDGKLSAGGAKSHQQQIKQLPSCHRMVVKKQKRRRQHNGERGEEKHRKPAVFALSCHMAHARVRRAGSKPARKACQRRQQLRIAEGRLNYQHCAEKGADNGNRLLRLYLFTQKDCRKHQCKKRRHFVEHRRIGGVRHMGSGIKIAEHTQQTGACAE